MSIGKYLDKIRNAVYGREVRESIAKGIETAYNDASEKHDNANMEVKLARGTHSNLNNRLKKMDEVDEQTTAQLAQTVEEVKDEITRRLGEFSVGTPLFANNVSEMTDVNRIYLNLSDSYLYVHDGSSFVSTGVPYLSNSIEEYMTTENEAWEVI